MSELSTLDALSEVYRTSEMDKDHSPGVVTLSMVGGCRKRAAFRLARQPFEWLVREARAADHGTALHDWLLPRLAARLEEASGIPADVERRVRWDAGDLSLHGRLDLFHNRRLRDLKTVGEHGLSRILRFGAKRAHIAQVGAYAIALEQDGEEVDDLIEVLYVDRATGEAEVTPIPTGFAQRTAEVWLADVQRGVELSPRDEKGPGLSIVCDGCEFLRACWGPGAVRGKVGGQEVLAPDAQSLGMALAAYDQASADEKDAKERKDFARAVIEGAAPGDYPGGHRLRWSGGWAPREVPDGKAAIARLEELGEPVPMMLDGGRKRSISVKPVSGVVEPPPVVVRPSLSAGGKPELRVVPPLPATE